MLTPPILSAAKVLKGSPALTLKQLIDYAVYSDKSQSVYFTEDVCSLKYILATVNGTSDVATPFEEALKKLLLKYFDSVDVAVTVEENGNLGIINIAVSVTDNNNTYTLDRVINVSDSDIVDKNQFWLDELQRKE